MGIGDDDVTKTCLGTFAYIPPEILMKTKYGKEADWYTLGMLTYEMLTGKIAFFNNNKFISVENKLGGIIKMPLSASIDFKDFIVALLSQDPKKRLGSGPEDIESIKSHPWMKPLDWEKMLNCEYEVIKPFLDNPLPKSSLPKMELEDKEKNDDVYNCWEYSHN